MSLKWQDSSYFSTNFVTEGSLILPSEYFATFETEVKTFKNALKGFVQNIEETEKTINLGERISLAHLDYEGSPETICVDTCYSDSDLTCALRLAEKNSRLNMTLSSMKNLKHRDTIKLHSMKYAGGRFLRDSDEIPSQCRRQKYPLVFSVRVYKPYMDRKKLARLELMQEFRLLGHNMLAQLANLIKCNHVSCGVNDVSDEMRHGDVWGTRDDARAMYSSAFFFIHNAFYRKNWALHPNDSSVELIAWLEKNKVGKFHSFEMNHCLQDINLQIGKPYVYQHLGQCEHVFVFSDVRLTSKSDNRYLHILPKVVSTGKMKSRSCTLCKGLSAKWMVKNCIKLTVEKAYLCQRCLLSYCYIDGRKVEDFQVYKYADPVSVS